MLSPIAATIPRRSVILPVTTLPKGQRYRPARRAEFSLDHRKHDHDRPHPGAADRADQQRERKPHPGLTGVGREWR
jgi:hypothetical protein